MEYKIQNTKYFGMMKCKIPNFSWVCLVPSKIPKFSRSKIHEAALLGFFRLLKPKSRMQNSNYFAKNFGWCLVPFCRMVGQNSNFFWLKQGTKQALNASLTRVLPELSY
jgi:hypothetical protein